MNVDDLKMLPPRPPASGNVVLRLTARNAAAVALAGVLAVGGAAIPAMDAIDAALAGEGEGVASAPAEAPAAEGARAVFEKSEVVYATLGFDGAPEAAYVVNRFDVESGGMLEDLGDYELVKNLSGTQAIAFEEGVAAMEVGEGTFFYQGNMGSVRLPWDISIRYALDGEEVSPADLAGADGRVAISLSTAQDPDVDPAFFDSFMLQVTFTLDGTAASGIQADGATVAEAGSSRTVAFTVLPGKEGSFELSMDATGFEMEGIQIAGVPYSSPIEVPDTSDVTAGMQQLADGVSEVASGSGALAGSGSALVRGADALASGVGDAAEASAGVAAGGASVLEGTDAMADAIARQAAAMSQLAAMLENVDASQLPPEAAGLAAQLEGLKQGVAAMDAGMQQLDGAYGQYAAGVEAYVCGVDALACGLADADAGASELAGGLRRYVAGVEELNGGIQSLDGETSKLPARVQGEIDAMMADFEFPEFTKASFASALNENVRSVQFIMATPAIAVAEDAPALPEEPEKTVADRFIDLFR